MWRKSLGVVWPITCVEKNGCARCVLLRGALVLGGFVDSVRQGCSRKEGVVTTIHKSTIGWYRFWFGLVNIWLSDTIKVGIIQTQFINMVIRVQRKLFRIVLFVSIGRGVVTEGLGPTFGADGVPPFVPWWAVWPGSG